VVIELFTGPDCAPCHFFKRVNGPWERVKAHPDFVQNAVFKVRDLATQSGKKAFARHKVTSVPTVHVKIGLRPRQVLIAPTYTELFDTITAARADYLTTREDKV
jgi:hypothetical protein